MKKYLALLLIFCLALSVLFPVFSMAEESIKPSSSEEASPDPSEEASPSPSGEVSPSPSEEVSPSPSEEVSPSPSEEVSPSPSVEPSPKNEVIDTEALYKTFMEFENDEDAEDFLSSLSDEELEALFDYEVFLESQAVAPQEKASVIDAGPLVTPVSTENENQPKAQVMHLMSARLMCSNRDTAGVELNKTAVQNADGTYTIRLESYTTGKVTTKTTGVPADIVLVLDQSSSMAYDFDNKGSKQDALKNAVSYFIDSVAEDAETHDVPHQIAIVTFGNDASTLSNFTNKYTRLKTTVEDLEIGKNVATNAKAGMEEAYSLLANTSLNSNHNKVVIVFTDGVPTTTNTFDTSVASGAISAAREIKKLGGTVYSIGVFKSADPDQLFGSIFDYKQKPRRNDIYDVPCNGNINEVWGASYELLYNYNYDSSFIEIAAGNRFLNYLSNNYNTALSIGIEGGEYNPGDYEDKEGWGYKITQVYTRTTDYHYYLTASDTGELKSVFQSISEQISSPDTTLGSNVAVKDFISDYFNMPATTDISVCTVACTGKSGETYTWSNTETPLGGAVIIPNSSAKTISVSGFAYDNQFVTEEPKSDGSYGSKLVVSFKVTPRPGFWGGNGVPTNTSASGLYAGTSLVEDFELPTVDVPINVPFTAKDISVYLGNEVNKTDLYNPITQLSGTDNWKDDYINVDGITYDATFTAKPAEDQNNITVSVNIPALNVGTVKNKTVTAAANISVYKPEITFKDSTIYLGEIANYAENFETVTWKHGDVIAVSSSMIGTAPILTYSYSPNASCFKTETPVDVSVKVDNWDITQYVTFLNIRSHIGSDASKEFTVKVETCKLVVSKSGCNDTYGDNQTFILHITGANIGNCDYADEVNLTVVVTGNGSKTIVGLPIGIYTITEEGSWSWRYTSGIGSVTLNRSNASGTFSVINTLNNRSWLSGANWNPNIFAKKAG